MISFEEFKKLEIKIGKIVEAERIEGSEKLVKLMVDVGGEDPSTGSTSSRQAGSGQGLRQIVAGIGLAYPNVEELIGMEIPILCNLEPKSLMGHTSYGMLLAADNKGRPVLLHPAEEVPPGCIIK